MNSKSPNTFHIKSMKCDLTSLLSFKSRRKPQSRKISKSSKVKTTFNSKIRRLRAIRRRLLSPNLPKVWPPRWWERSWGSFSLISGGRAFPKRLKGRPILRPKKWSSTFPHSSQSNKRWVWEITLCRGNVFWWRRGIKYCKRVIKRRWNKPTISEIVSGRIETIS